jgi:hypothetical protein
MEEGLHGLQIPLDLDLSRSITFDMKHTSEKKQILDQCIDKISLSLPGSERLGEVLKEYSRLTANNVEKQTPVTLFFSNPSLFFEIFWPQCREAIGRQYSILNFNSPIDLEMKLRFEMDGDKLCSPRDNMLYVCSLAERIPVALVFIEEKRRDIVPSEMLINKILGFLIIQDDVKYLVKRLRLQADDIESLIRQIVNKSKPLFVQFQGVQKGSSEIISMEVVFTGSLIPLGNEKYPFHKKLSLFLQENLVSIPIEEIDVTLSVLPKSPTTVLWIYIFAPPHYDISSELTSLASGMHCENNAPENPNLISYVFHRNDAKSSVSPIALNFRIAIPKQNKFWLAGLDKLLCSILAIWFLSTLSYFEYLKLSIFLNSPQPMGVSLAMLSEVFTSFRIMSKSNGFLEATFLIVTLVFVARNWFFHEVSAYRLCSRRFVWLLILISLLALINVFLYSNLNL